MPLTHDEERLVSDHIWAQGEFATAMLDLNIAFYLDDVGASLPKAKARLDEAYEQARQAAVAYRAAFGSVRP